MISVIKDSFMITSFVFLMMLIIEYINVLTKGDWQKRLTNRIWGKYLLAATLGVLPGCLGAFAVVTMYSHGLITIGAVVTTMIATSGDEAFVMLAMIPKQALLINIILFVVGMAVGTFTDFLIGKRKNKQALKCNVLKIHGEDSCVCLPPRGHFINQWQKCSAARGILTIVLAFIICLIVFGQLGPPTWTWVRVTLLAASGIALFIVCTVPDHFLEEHLWRHIFMKHISRVFLWTFGALGLMYLLTDKLHIDLETIIQKGKWIVLLAACLIGMIPESGPHLMFVTLYAQGIIPISIFLASSIVQDGHGMLPMLAHSKRAFIIVKGINFAAGILCGSAAMIFGF